MIVHQFVAGIDGLEWTSGQWTAGLVDRKTLGQYDLRQRNFGQRTRAPLELGHMTDDTSNPVIIARVG